MRLRREGAETGAEDLSLKSEAVTVDDKRVEGHADVMVTLDDDDEEKVGGGGEGRDDARRRMRKRLRLSPPMPWR